jgi:ribonuclease R
MKKNKDISAKRVKKIRNKLWFFIKSNDYTPITQKQLFIECSIPKDLEKVAKDCITEFIAKEMIFIKSHLIHFAIEKEPPTLVGKISIHPKGFGFVTPEDASITAKDVFIPKHLTLNAVDKDIVRVRVSPDGKKEKGPEGAVIEIVKRSRECFSGVIYELEKDSAFAFCPLLGESKTVNVSFSKKKPLKVGDRVFLEIENWETYPEKINTKVVKHLGHISDASKDIGVAIHEYKIQEDFASDTIEEAKKFSKNPTKSDLKNRVDLTEIESFTIDPDTAKDYDDALSLTKDKNDEFHLIVHIADVSYYVQKDSHLDKEAFERANSTYFPNKCVPMLPEELSNGLCSLKEDVVRLTVSVFMHFDINGELKSYDIRRTFIKSKKRFTYKEAKHVLDEKIASPHFETLKSMKELALLLQKKRRERGSIDLSLPEIVLKIDPKGVPVGFEVIEYDITHQLVEEFMLKANEIVAHALISRNIPTIFRVHQAPGSSESNDFLNVARAYGFKVKKSPSHRDIQQLFQEARSTSYLRSLSVAFIRSMKLAIYSDQNVGHFGLSLEHYCHFTSPIRRYSDLVVHRLLFEKGIPQETLQSISQHCSEKERISFKAEQSVINLKKTRYLHALFEEDSERIYEANVSKIKPFGLYFEVSGLHFEGFIHISEIGDDYYYYEEKASRLIGEKTRACFSSGVQIQVKIVHINLLKQEVIWNIICQGREKKKIKKKK